ncbi:cytochrome P450 2C38 [Arthroderma uncinatum]|uniref:cytochrome P450 2C38 n=1 Tax=Arthroderma uncinatum TaxID=74035 RepID=UPI00144ADFC0|nr:cytochrome P450 2C38 [Arthroderma uncinatum]KAF3480267.1 cytochrome P450 2C38 [Arthroderma uncinatum]
MVDKDERESIEFYNNALAVLSEVRGELILEETPILPYVPDFLARWKISSRRLLSNQTGILARNTNAALESGSWNWSKVGLREQETSGLSREELGWVIGNIYDAAHALPMALEVFVMASVLHQDAVREVQEELDRVVGSDRLPTFDDMQSLPRVNAFITEVLRWRPVTVGGMLHAVDRDDEYMGYRIPKGTTVVANHWSLEFDEKVFGDPCNFRPQRWIDNPSLPSASFGFGRRVCPGQHLARSSLFIIVSRVLWTYRIDYAYDMNGKRKDIDPLDMTQLSDSQPMPFDASFHVRSPKHQDIIEREHMACEKDLDVILNEVKPGVNLTTDNLTTSRTHQRRDSTQRISVPGEAAVLAVAPSLLALSGHPATDDNASNLASVPETARFPAPKTCPEYTPNAANVALTRSRRIALSNTVA